ncbi:MAG TPA: prepilin-type N-terminal cleavage/methylation domain-containing protein [Terracidiphilus sp.]|jgi:type IV pilus assembly protein PilA|nr:prepilin-type N-terminal cleavage/methylation domain-containing protein [Terracidiphilus sp.]HUX27719.1 prepilin-type N-terminal cleavage/methylation domain-containing protein [Terracidiphilus sp.]
MNRTTTLPIARRGLKTRSLSDCPRQRPNGFTLMELLIVIAIILILMLMAIPTIGSLTKKGNETSAINSVQTVTKAEIQYQSSYPASGFACTLGALGGDPNSGPPTPAAAQILQGDLTTGYKSGYIFTITCTNKVTINGTDRSNGYTITAVPQTVGKSGDRGFCSDQFGSIKYDPTGGTNCTQNLQ